MALVRGTAAPVTGAAEILGPTFDERRTHAVLEAACTEAGLEPSGAELLRMGENALWRLDCDVVVRIARLADYLGDATKEVAVARWLATTAVPAASVLDVQQPLLIDGHPVTFWRWIDGRPARPEEVVELGRVLSRLHQLPVPTELTLPPERILERVRGRIERAQVSEDDRRFLTALCSDLQHEIGQLHFPLAPGPTHGDAHIGNLMVREGGDAVLIDFERFAWGQPEWDLAMTATEFLSAGFWTTAEYGSFVEAYGFDVADWSGFPVLQAVHEIKMTTWIMQMTDQSPAIDREYHVRMAAIRDGLRGQRWQAF